MRTSFNRLVRWMLIIPEAETQIAVSAVENTIHEVIGPDTMIDRTKNSPSGASFRFGGGDCLNIDLISAAPGQPNGCLYGAVAEEYRLPLFELIQAKLKAEKHTGSSLA